jgi:pimeloyl-ACP methyl ester carboxylesterase
LLVALLSSAGGCRKSNPSAAAGSASSTPSASAAPPKRLPPLAAESWRVEIDVPGFAQASVAVPLGATEPRPVLIALHGSGDRPEWQCGTWRGITGHPFVLCPRGTPYPGGGEPRFTWKSAKSTEDELRAALRALKQRFGEHVAPGAAVLAGFSLGAIHALPILKQEPAFFSRIVLIEGGAETFTPGLAAIFARGGGKRALFVCSQSACREPYAARVRFLQLAGADAKLVDAGNLGHMFDGRVAAAVKRDFGWLVDGDPRWSSRAKDP